MKREDRSLETTQHAGGRAYPRTLGAVYKDWAMLRARPDDGARKRPLRPVSVKRAT